MHIFRHASGESTVAELAAAVESARSRGAGLEWLLAAGGLEAALSDVWSAEEDDWELGRQLLLEQSTRAARFYLGGEPGGGERGALAGDWPEPERRVRVGVPEGIRYYGLAPRSYVASARTWQEAASAGEAAWVLGLRTMGSILAPVVAAALRPAALAHRLTTLRPRGDPGNRHIRATPRLRQELRRWPGAFLIVDEGPGLSGSSFGGTVAFLSGLGVASERIALLPSWEVGPAAAARLGSAYAAQGWGRWRSYPAPPLPPPAGRGPMRNLSGGAWRQVLGRHREVPVWGQHERLKYLSGDGRGWIKFAGFGGWGERTRARARRLAQAGWGPALSGKDGEEGWIRYRRLRTLPLGARPGRGWAEWAGRYLAWVRSEYALGGRVPPTAELIEMVALNLERLFQVGPGREPPVGVPVALDGRMLECEWGQTAAGWVKFDGTDHGDDPFFPGPADIAWDLAALAVELGRDHGEAALAAYCRWSGESRTGLAPRLAWHGLAYRVFRAAYCQFAATQTGEPDAARFRREAARYRRGVAMGCAWRGHGRVERDRRGE